MTRTPPSAGRTLSAAKVKSGWLATSKKSAERRCVSRREFFVSIDSAATVMTPLTSPAAVTVPFPLTWRKTPESGRSPHVCLVLSRTCDRAGSSVQDPASVPSCSSACSAGEVSCPDAAMGFLRYWFGRQNYFVSGTV